MASSATKGFIIHEAIIAPVSKVETEMTDTPRIAMSPGVLPAQRLYEVVDLPSLPEGIEPVVCFGSDPDGIFPKRRPGRMSYLGSFEWAWSPMHNRITAYHLHRGRTHWFLYAQDLEPDDPDYTWMVLAHMRRSETDDRSAAIHLMVATWTAEAEDGALDEFHWINQAGLLSVAEWRAIARAVWGTA